MTTHHKNASVQRPARTIRIYALKANGLEIKNINLEVGVKIAKGEHLQNMKELEAWKEIDKEVEQKEQENLKIFFERMNETKEN